MNVVHDLRGGLGVLPQRLEEIKVNYANLYSNFPPVKIFNNLFFNRRGTGTAEPPPIAICLRFIFCITGV